MTINTLYVNAAGIQGQPRGAKKVTLENGKADARRVRELLDGPPVYLGYNDAGLTATLKAELAARFPAKSRFEAPERGIVTLAGGPIYATNAYINCRMLRNLGCTLPIEWCYLGAEMSPAWLDLIQRTIPDVRLVDLGGTNKDNTKGKGGWQAKVDAVIQSQFDELLFLDADSFPLRDPTNLFDHPSFREHDAVLWPDIHMYDANFQKFIRDKYGVEVQGRQIESGQMMFRKPECTAGLLKTQAINREPGAYQRLFGDKDTFLIGAKQAGVNVLVNPHVVRRASQRNLMQHDLDGQRMFAHLTKGKWRPNARAAIDTRDYPRMAEAEQIFLELRKSDAAMEIPPKMEINMHVRDSFCALEAARIISEDTYKIRPMIGHRVPVRYIVDIGANAGAFAFAASAAYPEAEILVIEPDDELMEDIRFNLRNCKAKIHCIHAACVGEKSPEWIAGGADRAENPQATVPYLGRSGSDVAGPGTSFIRKAGHRAGSFLRMTRWGYGAALEPGDGELTVPTVELPALLAQHHFSSIDILKIDAEGVEGEILQSLRTAGWMPRVHWIRGEWHGREDWPIIDAALRETHEYRLQDSLNNGELIAHNREDA
jgi:FkbM family methyltransferase